MSLQDLLHPKSEGASFVRDIIVILLIVAGIGIVLFGVSGTWPALVAVESGSMEPNLPTYSLVFVVDENRFGDWMTHEEAQASDASKVFNHADGDQHLFVGEKAHQETGEPEEDHRC